MTTRPLTYRIRECSYLPEHNRPHVWFEIDAGDDPRDYAAADYRPMCRVYKGRTREECEARIADLRAYALTIPQAGG
jgi:hypothetical protein